MSVIETTLPAAAGNPSHSAILEAARERARRERLPYGGSVDPQQAWALFSAGAAVLVDVRSAEELKFVGRVPEARHAAWQIGTPLAANPDFLRDLGAVAGKEDVVLLLCRSGKRSAAAARAAAAAGYANVFNVLEGFEGDLTPGSQRGSVNGWRHRGLPWVQD